MFPKRRKIEYLMLKKTLGNGIIITKEEFSEEIFMNQNEMFGGAKWICATTDDPSVSPIICRTFTANRGESAKIKLIGFATFELFVNGRRVGDDLFLPLNSAYESTGKPVGEEMRYRTYVTEYDISDYLCDGENVLCVTLGYGWYTGAVLWKVLYQKFGDRKLIYSINITDKYGAERYIVSDGSEIWRPSFVVGGDMHNGEFQDFSLWKDEYLTLGDKDGFTGVELAKPVETDYLYTDCPSDKIFEYRKPTLISKNGAVALYDAGRNISGYPILKAADGSEVTVRFSERLNAAGDGLDDFHMHGQFFSAKGADAGESLYPRFTWYGFRYFTVEGDAVPTEVAVVHSDVRVDSSFECSDETINWIYKTFIDTQLANMHRGIPSDCPHIERLGYTGDGQLICRSALHTFAAESFYRKWIGDISDCQDAKSGHVQYTAPYMPAGGGPAGWGSAIINVPYEFWKYYGDKKVLEENFDGMLSYIRFMEAHSESGLVISDIEGAWCLGDWCTPPDQTNIPAPFVNTCLLIIAMKRVVEIAKLLNKDADLISSIEEKIERCSRSVKLFYFNHQDRDSTFVGNVRGANAFGIKAGMGNAKTAEKLISYYDRTGHFDTGIFGTEMVIRVLFELGAADVAIKLLRADEPQGFGLWKKNGETTLPEYWNIARSHNHPMFGAVVATFFEYILGIRQEDDSAGYERIVISPKRAESLDYARGYITTPRGRIAVSYKKTGAVCEYELEVPKGASARISIEGMEDITVKEGVYRYSV